MFIDPLNSFTRSISSECTTMKWHINKRLITQAFHTTSQPNLIKNNIPAFYSETSVLMMSEVYAEPKWTKSIHDFNRFVREKKGT